MERRMFSYEQQLKEIIENSEDDDKILEIGPGKHYVSNILYNMGFDITTMDIKKSIPNTNFLNLMGDIRNIPLKENSFDVVCAFEVLEHIPITKLPRALYEMRRISRKKVIISLPYNDTKLIYKLKAFALSVLGKHIDRAGHYWELNIPLYSLEHFMNLFKSIGYSIKKHYRFKKNPYHYFFVLKKKHPKRFCSNCGRRREIVVVDGVGFCIACKREFSPTLLGLPIILEDEQCKRQYL